MPEPYDIIFPAAAIAYLVGQGAALYYMRGKWRIAAYVPLTIFLLALGLLIVGIFMGANLAGVYLVMAVPVCLVFILMLWAVYFGVELLGK